MRKNEIKRLAKDMIASFLQQLLDVDVIEMGLEMRQLHLSEEEIQELEQEIRAIVERLEK